MRALNAAAVGQRWCCADTEALQVVPEAAAGALDVVYVLGPDVVVDSGGDFVFGGVEGTILHFAAVC